jgi:hypothetical protein
VTLQTDQHYSYKEKKKGESFFLHQPAAPLSKEHRQGCFVTVIYKGGRASVKTQEKKKDAGHIHREM